MQGTPQRPPARIDLREREPRVAVGELERFGGDDGAVAEARLVPTKLEPGFPDFLGGADGLVVRGY